MMTAPEAVSGVKTAKMWALWGGRDGPNGVQNTSTQYAWVGLIHILHLGPLTDLYGTPGAPKGLVLAPKGFCGPQWARFGPNCPWLT